MSEQRFIEIETKLSHQEYLIEKLEETIFDQQTKIDQLEKALSQLVKTVDTSSSGNQIGPGNEKPPHY